MRTLLAPTEDFIKKDRTRLAYTTGIGSNVTIVLESNDGMADETFIVVGLEGTEKAEMAQVNQAVVAGTDVRVATLLRVHQAGEPVTVYRYNKRKFYGALTEDGSYTELTTDGSPVTIQVDDPQGTMLEYTGVEGYEYFKATYYNSADTVETEIADAKATNSDETLRYASLYGIRKMAGFTENPLISDGRIEDKRTQAENEIDSSLFNQYSLPLSEVPALITYICECLAAGYMHYEEFGPDGEGGKKLGEARALLKSIANGTQKLLGSDKTQLATVQSPQRLSGKPDGSEEGDELVKFKISQKF